MHLQSLRSPAGLFLIEEKVASVSASLNFSSWYTSKFDEYILEILNLVPATDGVALWMRVSTDGGSSYDSGAGRYQHNNYFTVANAAAATGSSSDTKAVLAGSISNTASNGGVSGLLRIFSPANTSMNKNFTGQTCNYSTTNSNLIAAQLIASSYMQTTAINGLQLLMSSGNITSGVARIYGVSK